MIASAVERRGETAAWVGPRPSLLFPPDAARAGVVEERGTGEQRRVMVEPPRRGRKTA